MKLIHSNDIKQIEFDVSILLGFPFSVSLLAYLSINFILPFLHGLALPLSMNQLLLLKLGQQVILQQNLVVLELLNRLNLQISLILWLSLKCAPCKREFFILPAGPRDRKSMQMTSQESCVGFLFCRDSYRLETAPTSYLAST